MNLNKDGIKNVPLNILKKFPDHPFSVKDDEDIFAPAELKEIYAKENTSEYYIHFGNVLNKKSASQLKRKQIS